MSTGPGPPQAAGGSTEKAADAPAGLADWPLHPFLLGAYAVVALYASNLRETRFEDVAVPLALILALALALFLGFGALLRRFGSRAGIMASVVLAAGLFHADIVAWLGRVSGVSVPEAAQAFASLGVTAALLLLLAVGHARLTLLNAVLNGIALVLFAAPAWQAASFEWNTVRPPSPVETKAFAEDQAALAAAPAVPPAGGLPDIYYFIFDRYASEGVLSEFLGFDNRPLADFLRDQGFYVASRSVSNYLKTAPSLASSLSMDYINFLSGEARTRRGDWRPIYDMLDDHRVARIVKARGYRFVQVGAWWGPTQKNSFADASHSFGFTEFNWLLLRRTILPPLFAKLASDSAISRQMQWDNAQCRRVPLQMQAVKRAADGAQPTFSFAHVLLPHEPFVFDADGRCLSGPATWKRGFDVGYVGQLRYANTLIRDMVTELLARPGLKPIIVIQADEGPFPERYRLGDRSWRDATAAELRMKTGILNAYFFPDRDYAALDPAITPVNTFRIVFNKVFGTNFARLPDRVWASPTALNPYEFFDVTEVVRAPAALPDS